MGYYWTMRVAKWLAPYILEVVLFLFDPTSQFGLYSFILRIKLYDLKTEVNQDKVKLRIK
jgi:hypothetical protein